jgi:citrate lyase subunit beta/citryl-CoA lyase
VARSSGEGETLSADPSFALVARSFLFVPGDDLEKLASAWSRGADVVVVDLEDSVPRDRKHEARSITADHVDGVDPHLRARTWVRVNNKAGLIEADLDAIAARQIAGVVVPKVSDPDRAADLRSAIDAAVGPKAGYIPMIETAGAVLDARQIAAVAGVSTLMLGEYDLTAELGMSIDARGAELASIRVGMVVACAAAGVAPPIAAVSADFDDESAFRESSLAMRRMGFFGRALIHPRQIEIANTVFAPTPDEIEEAERTLAAWADEGGAMARDGRLVDEATIRHARRIRALGARLGLH